MRSFDRHATKDCSPPSLHFRRIRDEWQLSGSVPNLLNGRHANAEPASDTTDTMAARRSRRSGDLILESAESNPRSILRFKVRMQV